MDIIPGILEKEWSAIEQKLAMVKPFAKTVHIDLLDGKFAPNTTWMDPKPFAKFSKDFVFELHMMVDNPLQYVKPFADAGFTRFLGHIEKMSDQAEFIATAEMYGDVGLAIDGPTSLGNIKVAYEDLDCLLFMTIKAGMSGQAFEVVHLEKIKALRQAQGDMFEITANGKPFPIEVDGGINDQTILLARDAGATRFITTSYLFGSPNPAEQYKKLQTLLNS